MKITLPDYVNTAIRKLNDAGYECYVVGGAVRSSLLNLPVHDYDLTTSALPEQTKEVFKELHIIETGIKHGTVTVVIDHHPLEITTYRKETEYKDHRHPDEVIFTSALQEDCARRDFTVNALCYHPQKGILDFYNGLDDLEHRIIRCIRDPEERFDEDALRILRAVRFASRLNFSIEERTLRALHEKRELLQYISKERIHEETESLLAGNIYEKILTECLDVLTVYIPVLGALSPQKWTEIVEKINQCSSSAQVRMAVMLSAVSIKDAEQTLKDLKYSNHDTQLILALLKKRNEPVSSVSELKHLLSSLDCSYEDYFSFRCALDSDLDYSRLVSKCDGIIKNGECISLKQLDVKGNDLIVLGIRGKEIAYVLNALLNDVIDGRQKNKKEELLARAMEIHSSIF